MFRLILITIIILTSPPAFSEDISLYKDGWRGKPLYDKMLKHGLIKGQ